MVKKKKLPEMTSFRYLGKEITSNQDNTQGQKNCASYMGPQINKIRHKIRIYKTYIR